MLVIPEIHVGAPIEYEALTVFPLTGRGNRNVNYLLSDEALTAGSVTVEEVGEAGSVPELTVNNQTDGLVLFLEGEELRGAKQNRVLNTSVLVAAKSKIKIPVSCVEQGRWRYSSPHFTSGGSHSSSKLRHILKKSVLLSAKAGHGHQSDQGQVWNEVGRQMASLGSHSDTGAMADTFGLYKDRLVEYQSRLKYVEGATGLAVAVGDRIVSIDLFDKPSTCQKVWDRLLTGMILDALEAGPKEKPVTKVDAEHFIATLRNSSWEKTNAAGAGEEYRSATDDKHASALICEGAVVHGSMVLA